MQEIIDTGHLATKRMNFCLHILIRFVRFLRGVKNAERHTFVHDFYFRRPFRAAFSNTCIAAGVGRSKPFAVLRILSGSCLSKVAKPIVVTLSVNVVNMLRWPRASHVQPRQTMPSVQNVVQTDAPIAVLHPATCQFAWSATATNHFPSKNASFWVIVNQFAQALRRDSVVRLHGRHNINCAVSCQA